MSAQPRPRRTSDELRALIVNAGLQVLYRRGLRADASHVPMTEALNELEATHGITVSMGSIFGPERIWPSVREFQLDLLDAALRDTDRDGPNDQGFSLIDQLPDAGALPLEERIDMLVDVCRIAGLLNGYVPEPDKSRTWTLWVAIWATSMADNETGSRLIPALRDTTLTTTERFSAVYAVMLAKLGLRIRAPYTLDQMSLLAASVTDGIALRSGVIPERLTAPEDARGPGDWNLLGIGLTAIALEFVEDDPGVTLP